MKNLNILIAIFFASFLIACQQKEIKNEINSNTSESLNIISQEQFTFNNMKIGSLKKQLFETSLACNGSLSAPTNGIAKISTPIPGIVKNIHFTIGDYVEKHELICEIESQELINLQQNYAESSVELMKAKADYERCKTLSKENIGANKDLISAESKYRASNAIYEGFKLKLELLNLNKTQVENGKFVPSLNITAPISGYITHHNLVLGKYVEPQQSLIEIIDTEQIQVQISLFEKDIHKIKIGQLLHFNAQNNPTQLYTARISSIGKSIDPKTKTITCFAKLDKKAKNKLFNGACINADIIINSKEANALPSQAIIKSGLNRYIFIVEKHENNKYYLRKEKIETGNESGGYTEILNSKTTNNILVKGGYNISAE